MDAFENWRYLYIRTNCLNPNVLRLRLLYIYTAPRRLLLFYLASFHKGAWIKSLSVITLLIAFKLRLDYDVFLCTEKLLLVKVTQDEILLKVCPVTVCLYPLPRDGNSLNTDLMTDFCKAIECMVVEVLSLSMGPALRNIVCTGL